MLACDEGNIEMVDLLLQYSADPNLQQPVSKIEVLYYICSVCWEVFAWYVVVMYGSIMQAHGTNISTLHILVWNRFIDSSISKVSHLKIAVDTQYWKKVFYYSAERLP